MASLPRGLCIPLPVALDASGRFDALSQERLMEWVRPAKAAALISSPGLEALNPELSRQATSACHYASPAAPHWAGVSAPTVEALLMNLEHALKLGVQAAVLNPLACQDAPDPLALFHRRILPLFEKSGKSLPLLLEDSGGGEARLRTRDLKQLTRLDEVMGLTVSAGPKIVGNYLKGARHFKARHEFGVYLGNAEMIFSLFKPASGPLGALREQWLRLWMGAEHPQGVAPLGAELFPSAL